MSDGTLGTGPEEVELGDAQIILLHDGLGPRPVAVGCRLPKEIDRDDLQEGENDAESHVFVPGGLLLQDRLLRVRSDFVLLHFSVL